MVSRHRGRRHHASTTRGGHWWGSLTTTSTTVFYRAVSETPRKYFGRTQGWGITTLSFWGFSHRCCALETVFTQISIQFSSDSEAYSDRLRVLSWTSTAKRNIIWTHYVLFNNIMYIYYNHRLNITSIF